MDNKKSRLVSIVIPTYNREGYIVDTLDSLKNQTYKEIEIVVIDDCSKDNTENVVKDWIRINKDSIEDVIYLKLPRNRDEWWALNIGFYICNGEYIAIHGSDDLSHEEKIEKQMKCLFDDIDVAAVGTSYKTFEKSIDNIVGFANWLSFDREEIERNYKEVFSHCICFGTIVFRANILDEIIGCRKATIHLNDYNFVSDIVTNDYVVENLNEHLYYYRIHEGQKSKKIIDTNFKYIPEPLKQIKDRVSVVMAVDNNTDKECMIKTLDSISSQTYENIEIIIVDNNTDNGIDDLINNWYSNIDSNSVINDLIYFKLPRYTDYIWCINIGAYMAKGEYIAFHGSGISDKYRIEKQFNYMKNNFTTSLIGTNYTDGYVKYDEDIEYSYKIDYVPCINFSTTMVRTNVINETGGLSRSIIGREEFEFIYRLIDKGYRLNNLEDILYYE